MAHELELKTPQTPWQEYLASSRSPLVSLAFVAPLLVIYEIGVLLPGRPPERNGADVLLRQLLDLVGFGQYLLLPLLTCGILIAWHHLSKESWRMRWSWFGGMVVESIVFAGLLIVIHDIPTNVLRGLLLNVESGEVARGPIHNVVMFCGAGIYEELLFRLMLFPALWGVFVKCGLGETRSPLLAIVVSSVLFSAAHYLPGGDDLQLMSFTFRFVAGIFFAFLFYYRGFGIAAVSHTFYDIAVTFLF